MFARIPSCGFQGIYTEDMLGPMTADVKYLINWGYTFYLLKFIASLISHRPPCLSRSTSLGLQPILGCDPVGPNTP